MYTYPYCGNLAIKTAWQQEKVNGSVAWGVRSGKEVALLLPVKARKRMAKHQHLMI